ncbi:MAG: type II toxin-antitoxin system RelE/ParE family toxin [Pyrinomonadaceae bacterium]|jgi:proteic killer suppression protein|nr:type II toxin-antitoxin system RelE/ParE family toxin [Pyrinomonadaceae bacterium]
MIKSFAHKGLRRLFETGKSRGVAADLQKRLIRQMDVLNAALVAQDMNLPGYRFHELRGDRRGTYSVTVSGNWRLTFKFQNGDAHDVDLEDYH